MDYLFKIICFNIFNLFYIKLSYEQYNVIYSIAKELKIPPKKVLWIFIEFGQGLLILSQQNKSIAKEIKKRNKLPEYKNWEKIAKLHYEFWKAGEEKE